MSVVLYADVNQRMGKASDGGIEAKKRYHRKKITKKDLKVVNVS